LIKTPVSRKTTIEEWPSLSMVTSKLYVRQRRIVMKKFATDNELLYEMQTSSRDSNSRVSPRTKLFQSDSLNESSSLPWIITKQYKLRENQGPSGNFNLSPLFWHSLIQQCAMLVTFQFCLIRTNLISCDLPY
jgi:hypothetical protein